MNKPNITMIAAMTENRVIGRDNDMPWHIPADLAHFKRLTLDKPIVMGRKVFESLGCKPLPKRHNIVLSRNPDYEAPGCTLVSSPEQALQAAGAVPEVMIIGGEQIYRLFLEQAHRVHLTLIHAVIEGDTFFPELGPGWRETAREKYAADARSPYDLSFLTFEKTNQL